MNSHAGKLWELSEASSNFMFMFFFRGKLPSKGYHDTAIQLEEISYPLPATKVEMFHASGLYMRVTVTNISHENNLPGQ